MLSRLLSTLLLISSPLLGLAAEPPEFLNEALLHFDPNIPADHAYTVTTTRGTETSVERFDPSLPPEAHWTLLLLNGQPATPEAMARYSNYRISTSRSTQPTFLRGDIDRTTLRLLREDETRAIFTARFREGLEDALLAKLELQLTVVKSTARVAAFRISLTEPHSPVLTVKMLSLQVDTSLSPEAHDHPALPSHTSSRFRGRVFFFKGIEENIDTTYSNFTRVSLPPSTGSGR